MATQPVAQGQGEDMRGAQREEEELLIITRLHQVPPLPTPATVSCT